MITLCSLMLSLQPSGNALVIVNDEGTNISWKDILNTQTQYYSLILCQKSCRRFDLRMKSILVWILKKLYKSFKNINNGTIIFVFKKDLNE